MNIKKKIYKREVARQVFIFHIIYTRLAQMDSLSFGLIIIGRKI